MTTGKSIKQWGNGGGIANLSPSTVPILELASGARLQW